MKREIKFRAWDKRFKKMVYDVPMAILYLNDSDHEVMQYTGLIDKNGKEIYEGDIFAFLDSGNGHEITRGEVRCFGHYFDVEINGKAFVWDNYSASQGEIIGNVYENPELINNKVS